MNGGALKLNQALHGYHDGHRLIATSLSLNARDQKTMLILSDQAGSGAATASGGYLSGYPLPDSGIYALARTWPASEISRPGCVWTHTLLITFEDLALIPELCFLDRVFRRPAGIDSAKQYQSEIVLNDEEETSDSLPPDLRATLRKVLKALYESPSASVIAPADEHSDDIAYRVWTQQWPDLRRSFRFCTSATADRSSASAMFDLQFVPRETRQARSRFRAALDTERQPIEPEEWLESALADVSGCGGGLRTFLASAGEIVKGGREMFVPLYELSRLIKKPNPRPEDVEHAIDFLEPRFAKTTKDASKPIRRAVLLLAANCSQEIGKRALDYFISNADLLDADEISQVSTRIGLAIWRQNPERFVGLFSADGNLAAFVTRVLSEMDIKDIVSGFDVAPNIVPDLISHRPQVLDDSTIWASPAVWQLDAISKAAEISEPSPIIRALIAAHRSDLRSGVVRYFGISRMLRELDFCLASDGLDLSDESLRSWVVAASTNATSLAAALSGKTARHWRLLAAIARLTNPDFVPSEYGEDPWLVAFRRPEGKASMDDRQYLAAYCLCRALGFRSNNSAELIALSLDEIYFAALKSQLKDEAFSVISERVPSSWWDGWDRCMRIRNAVVDVFMWRNLPPDVFANVTQDDDLFAELAKLCANSGKKGRAFLKRVAESLHGHDDVWSYKRFGIVINLINSPRS